MCVQISRITMRARERSLAGRAGARATLILGRSATNSPAALISGRPLCWQASIMSSLEGRTAVRRLLGAAASRPEAGSAAARQRRSQVCKNCRCSSSSSGSSSCSCSICAWRGSLQWRRESLKSPRKASRFCLQTNWLRVLTA